MVFFKLKAITISCNMDLLKPVYYKTALMISDPHVKHIFEGELVNKTF